MKFSRHFVSMVKLSAVIDSQVKPIRQILLFELESEIAQPNPCALLEY